MVKFLRTGGWQLLQVKVKVPLVKGNLYLYLKVPLDIQPSRVRLQGTVLIPVSKPQSQCLSEDSFCGHVASTTRHRTPLPSHRGGTYLSTCICMLLNCQVGRSWDKRRELTPSCGFNLVTAGLLTLQHRGFCGLISSATMHPNIAIRGTPKGVWLSKEPQRTRFRIQPRVSVSHVALNDKSSIEFFLYGNCDGFPICLNDAHIEKILVESI